MGKLSLYMSSDVPFSHLNNFVVLVTYMFTRPDICANGIIIFHCVPSTVLLNERVGKRRKTYRYDINVPIYAFAQSTIVSQSFCFLPSIARTPVSTQDDSQCCFYVFISVSADNAVCNIVDFRLAGNSLQN